MNNSIELQDAANDGGTSPGSKEQIAMLRGFLLTRDRDVPKSLAFARGFLMLIGNEEEK